MRDKECRLLPEGMAGRGTGCHLQPVLRWKDGRWLGHGEGGGGHTIHDKQCAV